MRVSVLKSDPGFIEDWYFYDAYLDGVRLTNCITADEELGTALVYSLDEKGKLIQDGDEMKTETLTGKVEVKKRE